MNTNIKENLILSSPAFVRHKEYWQEKLSGEPGETRLLEKEPYPGKTGFPAGAGEQEAFDGQFSPQLSGAILALSKRQDLALYMVLLSGLKALICLYTGNQDITVVSPLYDKALAAAAAGPLNDYVLIRDKVTGAMSFKEILLSLRQSVGGAYDHQDYPFDTLMNRFTGPIPSQVICSLSSIHHAHSLNRRLESGMFSEALHVVFKREADLLSFGILYTPGMYRPEFIRQLAAHLKAVYEQALADTGMPVSKIEYMTPDEKKYLIQECNDTSVQFPPFQSIAESLEVSAQKSPDALALVSTSDPRHTARRSAVTYKELDRRANRLASLLRARGAGPETIVAVFIAHPALRIHALLAILKTGAAYLPMAPDHPLERNRYIIADSAAPLLVIQQDLLEENRELCAMLAPEQVISLNREYSPGPEENALKTHGKSANMAADLAYVMYTSGTTGRPKGVMIRQRNVMNLLHWFCRTFALQAGDRVMQMTDYTFDPSVEQIFGGLMSGAAVYTAGRDLIADVRRFRHFILEEDISFINFVPPYLKELLAEREKLPSLRLVISGGEKLEDDIKDLILARGYTLYNNYGPTEAATDALSSRCGAAPVSLGKPVANVWCLVLNNDAVAPPGVSGELVIGGAGIARGYMNRPELTAEKFTPSPFPTLPSPGYRTGDRVRRLPDGDIQFLGRIDQQVKIHGHRIEPGEIRTQLLRLPGIGEALVTTAKDRSGESFLAAYFVPVNTGTDSNRATPGPEEIRARLLDVLPEYMIPSYFIPLESMPLTPGGKPDTSALPAPSELETIYVAPRNAVEEMLVEIWSQLLEMEAERIGIDANFFALGGHSLKATMLLAEIHNRMDVNVALNVLFQNPTVRALSSHIQQRAPERFSAIQPCEEKEYYPQSSAQKRLFILERMSGSGMAYNMPQTYPLAGNMDISKLESVFMQLIRRHESLRTSFFMLAEEPVQRVLPARQLSFSVQHIRLTAHQAEESRLDTTLRQLKADFIRPFDLSRPPLIRACLISVDDDRGILLLDMHHIITDGTSQHILGREVTALYSGQTLDPLVLQYKDYTQWLNSPRQKQRLKEQETYWLDRLSGELPVLNLPTDYPRPAIQSFEGRRVRYWLDRQETAILKDLCREHEVTLYMALLTVCNILFARLSGQDDIIIGTPIAARRHKDLEHIVGMLVNTIVLRNFPQPEKTLGDFLAEVKQHTIEAFDNQEYQFEDLVDLITPDRDVSRNPVFDVMLNLLNEENKTGSQTPSPEIMNRPPEHTVASSRFDMAFSATETGDCISLTVEYASSLFKESAIDRITGYLKKVIASLPSAGRREIGSIEIIGPEEKQQVLEFSNGPGEEIHGPPAIHQWFQQQVERTPDQVALSGPERSPGITWTYDRLNRKANRLAHLLRRKGVGPGSIVAVMMERSKELIAAILAVLKAGGAYLPLDPEYPSDRVLTMLEDSGASVLLSKRDILGSFPVTSLQGLVPVMDNLVVTPRRAQIRDLDAMPIPDRTLIDYEKYHQYIGEAPARNTITLQATRGCPYNCLYCHKIWPKTHFARGAEHIFNEIKISYDAGVRRFVFIDDIFNLKEKNARQFLEKIIAANMDVQLFFPNGFRGDILNKEFIDLMVEAGTVNIDVALESASPRIQKLIKKHLKLDVFKENVQYIAETYPHVILEMEMMHGFPSETEEEALMTLEFLKDIKWVHFPNLHVLKIFPNTDMYRLALESGITPASIQRSADMAYHQLPDTLPFAKSFSRQFQAQFMRDYFLLKERLLHVLPNQMKVLNESELVQKYDSYLPVEIKSFEDILRFTGVKREELGDARLITGDYCAAPQYREKVRRFFPASRTRDNAFRVLLLDLSQMFSESHEAMLHFQIEEPLGLLYLMTYLNDQFKEKIAGKVFKSRIDFDDYEELKRIVLDFKPDLIGIRTLSYYKDFFHRTVMLMRQWGVDAPIVSGGPYATSDYSLILQDANVDLVVLGEGELVLAELIEKMMANHNNLPADDVLEHISGLAFVRDKDKPATRLRNRDILMLDEMEHSLSTQPERNPEPVNRSGDMLYVIYTSGSTGTPKGVALEHRNLVNLLQYQYDHTGIDFSRVLQFTTISFDVSFQEIFSTLAAGGCLSLVTKDTLNDVPRLFGIIKQEEIKTVFMPASYLKFIIDESEYGDLPPKGLEHIVTAGEQIVVNESFRRYLTENHIALHNHYGPSETHVVTALTLNPGGHVPELPPIGKPLTNTIILILDGGMNLQPPGIPGELYIGGIQVGRGYLNNPELTAERFLPAQPGHSSYRSHRCYKTGDLARWLEDGNIQFLGRADYQVKIRGFRVELGEIESRLMEHPGVRDAVVLALPDQKGGNYLCAYVVSASASELDNAELRDYLSLELPDYMLPSYFMELDEIPLTPNRKLDRRALPSPEASANENYIAPSSKMEIALTAIWAEVLDLEKRVLGVEDNFFRLGGHSLKATVMTARIHKQLGVKIALTDIFQHPTIKAMAQHLEESSQTMFSRIEPVEKKEYYPLSSAQKRLYILQKMEPESTAYNMPKPIPLSQTPDIETLEKTFKQLIARHESLRTSYIELDGQPLQKVHDHTDFNIGTTAALDPAASIDSLIEPFDLSRAPLLRVKLFESAMFIDMHHIITDEVSQGIMEREFMALSSGNSLPPLTIRYKDYACWQNLPAQKENIKRQETWWLEQFSGHASSPGLPVDFPRTDEAGFEGGTLSFHISGPLYDGVKNLCLELNITLMMFLLSVYKILLHRYTGREDVVVGTVAAGRPHHDLQNIIGFFVNMLPLKTPPPADKTFSQFAASVKTTALNAFENQDYPFEELVDRLDIQRQPGRQPLIETVFVFRDDSASASREIPDQEERSNVIRSSHFDLMLHSTDLGNAVRLVFEYSSSLFKKNTIKELAGFYKEILLQVSRQPGLALSDIALSHGLKPSKSTVNMDDDDDWL